MLIFFAFLIRLFFPVSRSLILRRGRQTTLDTISERGRPADILRLR